jgi:alkylated DNA repair dioxygenase AlkB
VTLDLFQRETRLQRLPIEGAEVFYASHVDWGVPDNLLTQRLIDEVPWRAESVTVWGKKFNQPRLIAWFGDAGRAYTYSGIRLIPLPWSDLLLEIRGRVQDLLDCQFNSVLANYYRDERDSMGFHSDDEAELGQRPVIASISLGEERAFLMKHKRLKNLVRLPLPSGSLLVMKGDTQKNWKHAIAKESRKCAPRVNLTFRSIIG